MKYFYLVCCLFTIAYAVSVDPNVNNIKKDELLKVDPKIVYLSALTIDESYYVFYKGELNDANGVTDKVITQSVFFKLIESLDAKPFIPSSLGRDLTLGFYILRNSDIRYVFHLMFSGRSRQKLHLYSSIFSSELKRMAMNDTLISNDVSHVVSHLIFATEEHYKDIIGEDYNQELGDLDIHNALMDDISLSALVIDKYGNDSQHLSMFSLGTGGVATVTAAEETGTTAGQSEEMDIIIKSISSFVSETTDEDVPGSEHRRYNDSDVEGETIITRRKLSTDLKMVMWRGFDSQDCSTFPNIETYDTKKEDVLFAIALPARWLHRDFEIQKKLCAYAPLKCPHLGADMFDISCTDNEGCIASSTISSGARFTIDEFRQLKVLRCSDYMDNSVMNRRMMRGTSMRELSRCEIKNLDELLKSSLEDPAELSKFGIGVLLWKYF